MSLYQLRSHRKLLLWVRDHSTYACERRRAHILLACLASFSHRHIAHLCACARSTVVRLLGRLAQLGLWARVDPRRFNGSHHPEYLQVRRRLPELIAQPPEHFGWGRSRWSYELLARQLTDEFGRGYHPGHLGRVLTQCQLRHVVPSLSIARQPYDHYEQAFRLFERFVGLPEGDIVLFADEVDLNLNPKVGPVLAPQGQRPELVTPGQNRKRYLAGTYNPLTGHLIWVWDARKASALFIDLCREVARRYRAWGTIHLVVDHYSIHTSRKTRAALEDLDGKIELHFLPAYSPESNDIEQVWGVLHEAVTRCHRCTNIKQLCERVDRFLEHVRDHGLEAASHFCAA